MQYRSESHRTIVVAVSAFVLASLFGAFPVSAQTYSVIHSFTGGGDGAYPYAGLSIDSAGNLYGTALAGGKGNCQPANEGCGVVFKMKQLPSGWIFTPIYGFLGDTDGAGPYGRVILGSDGSLYGSTISGGDPTCLSGCGTVFSLMPPPTACQSALCPWHETVLYRFAGNSDGFYPAGDVTFDSAGNLYGTTTQGGSFGPGTVYRLTPSNGGWTESVLYSLTGNSDGGNPYSGVTFDGSGNLYVATLAGGVNNYGALFELSPSGSAWVEQTLHDFQGGNDGGFAQSGLLFAAGNLYGATSIGGSNGGGTVFELTPSGGGWTLDTLYDFSGMGQSGPYANLTMDAAGNLYGTTQGNGGAGDQGCVFKLSRSGSGWKETVLYRFTGAADGGFPFSALVFDAAGSLYGTTLMGGASDRGVVFKITP